MIVCMFTRKVKIFLVFIWPIVLEVVSNSIKYFPEVGEIQNTLPIPPHLISRYSTHTHYTVKNICSFVINVR
jgi:hypothetical protein